MHLLFGSIRGTAVNDNFFSRLFGQPVNVREQQDAFEFYTQIVDQADEFLHSQVRKR